MVAPLIARGLMSAGAKMLGSAGTRSVAGQALRTGKIKVGLEGKGLMHLAEIGAGVWESKKIMQALVKSSPALKQQMIIFGKGIMLLLRPIGDIIAKFVRPGMIWLMKFAAAWYKKFGVSSESKEGEEDKKEQLESQLKTAEQGGNPEVIALAKRELSEFEKNRKFKSDDEGSLGSPEGLEKALEEASGVALIWESIKTLSETAWGWAKDYVDYAVKFNSFIVEIFKFFDNLLGRGALTIGVVFSELSDSAIRMGLELWENIKGVGSKLKKAGIWVWDTLQKGADKIIDGFEWIGEKLDEFGMAIFNWAEDIWNDYIAKGFENVVNWGNDLWTMIKDAFATLVDKVTSWSPFGKSGSSAVGGKINKTGLYELHAGEEVLRAGDVSNSSNTNAPINIVNHYNINATINDEMDIQNLVHRLAEYNETELRRRSSYI